jgi:hypothetical protein
MVKYADYISGDISPQDGGIKTFFLNSPEHSREETWIPQHTISLRLSEHGFISDKVIEEFSNIDFNEDYHRV